MAEYIMAERENFIISSFSIMNFWNKIYISINFFNVFIMIANMIPFLKS